MFRTLKRALLRNPFDQILLQAKKQGKKRFLLGWNRGLGDIPLGLYLLTKKIKKTVEQAEVTFLIRKDLEEGFFLFPEVKAVVDESFQRGKPYSVQTSSFIDAKNYDVVIEWPDPTYWCKDLIGKITPKLTWKSQYDDLWKGFSLEETIRYVGIQPSALTGHGPWRSWDKKKFSELVERIYQEKNRQVLLFGEKKEHFSIEKGIDLRGKTSLLELLSIIRHLCSDLVLIDSGILSILYYIKEKAPLHIVSLWAKPLQGVMKQNVLSPNPLLIHDPIIGRKKTTESISVEDVLEKIPEA